MKAGWLVVVFSLESSVALTVGVADAGAIRRPKLVAGAVTQAFTSAVISTVTY